MCKRVEVMQSFLTITHFSIEKYRTTKEGQRSPKISAKLNICSTRVANNF